MRSFFLHTGYPVENIVGDGLVSNCLLKTASKFPWGCVYGKVWLVGAVPWWSISSLLGRAGDWVITLVQLVGP